MNKLFHRWTVLSWKVLLVYLCKQARSWKERMNASITPKCIWKLILRPCVTSKYSVLIFPRLSQWLYPTKWATNTAVTESGHRAGSQSRSDASGEHRAEPRVQQCYQLNELGLAERENTFLQAPPPLIKAKDSLRIWNTRADRPKSALGRREAHGARPEREGGPQAPALLSRALKRVSKGPTQKVLSKVLHKTHLKKAQLALCSLFSSGVVFSHTETHVQTQCTIQCPTKGIKCWLQLHPRSTRSFSTSNPLCLGSLCPEFYCLQVNQQVLCSQTRAI